MVAFWACIWTLLVACSCMVSFLVGLQPVTNWLLPATSGSSQTLQCTVSSSSEIINQGNSPFHFNIICFKEAADFLTSVLSSRPAFDAVRFWNFAELDGAVVAFGFAAVVAFGFAAVVAFGFRNENSVPCCFAFHVSSVLEVEQSGLLSVDELL